MFTEMSYYLFTPVILVVIIILFASVRILRQYERAVVFTLGKFERVKGPSRHYSVRPEGVYHQWRKVPPR